MEITIEHQPSAEKLAQLGVKQWPIWTKEASEFDWFYDEAETCYLLAGDVTVTPEGGEPVRFGQGDLVTFPAGMACVWNIHSDVKKHYAFG
ncbi:cupin domain-containing protein [Alkalinema sp. FACHB-956]|uniref:cupin domain-containing protein n=1 Tax=Alkalinema sp. FACHB-956 TaxID=2692768 RepID=UPI001685CE7A|nr:cupin domain-containing protein [Alkalinema sp. FACHB-956]MBD2329709.1 cupin domain-containing protein [Alkalinema sp. FACHB-956]